jgi:hypothetical protein
MVLPPESGFPGSPAKRGFAQVSKPDSSFAFQSGGDASLLSSSPASFRNCAGTGLPRQLQFMLRVKF